MLDFVGDRFSLNDRKSWRRDVQIRVFMLWILRRHSPAQVVHGMTSQGLPETEAMISPLERGVEEISQRPVFAKIES